MPELDAGIPEYRPEMPVISQLIENPALLIGIWRQRCADADYFTLHVFNLVRSQFFRAMTTPAMSLFFSMAVFIAFKLFTKVKTSLPSFLTSS